MVFMGKGSLAVVSANAIEHKIPYLGLNLYCDCKESRKRAVCVAAVRNCLVSSKILQCIKSFLIEISVTRIATFNCIFCV